MKINFHENIQINVNVPTIKEGFTQKTALSAPIYTPNIYEYLFT